MGDVSNTEDEWLGEEESGEDGAKPFNPIGEYYGGRNDKNERHGRGRAEMPNGDVYLGCYFRGKRHGLGVYRYKNGNGARYGGDWYLSTKCGWGTMYFPDGSQYTGLWKEGRIHGWGVYVYPNGDEYEGWWYMGHKNGRGIYRSKKAEEKFVGNWIMGLRQGKGMLIRKEYRFIGNWYNDCPKGPGVYIFPDLGVEQHGSYTMLRLQQAESIKKYQDLGYQVFPIRADPPPKPLQELEQDTRMALSSESNRYYQEEEGEGQELVPVAAPAVPSSPEEGDNNDKEKKPVDITAKTPEQEFDTKVYNRMIQQIEADLAAEAKNQVQVVPIWKVVQITRLMTPWPDDTVPPPPIPDTPVPLIEPEDEFELEEEEEEEVPCDEEEFEEAMSLFLAKDHQVGDPYTGSGTCQLNMSQINWPDDCPVELKCSTMSFSTLGDFKSIVQSVLDKPLEPIDFEKIISQNRHLFKSTGMVEGHRWKDCLGQEVVCGKTQLRGFPRHRAEKKPQDYGEYPGEGEEMEELLPPPQMDQDEEEEEEGEEQELTTAGEDEDYEGGEEEEEE